MEEDIRVLQKRWMDAWVNRDWATLEATLDDDFVLIVSAAFDRPMNRAAWLAATEHYIGEWFRYDQMTVRIFGEFAVVASIATFKASVSGVDRSGTMFVTDVWRRRNGSWRVIERHSSHPEPATASAESLARLTQQSTGSR